MFYFILIGIDRCTRNIWYNEGTEVHSLLEDEPQRKFLNPIDEQIFFNFLYVDV